MTVKLLVETFFAWVKEVGFSNRLSKGKTLKGSTTVSGRGTESVPDWYSSWSLDNNVTEGALRSFCLQKHAWKLIDSIDGAKSRAIIYSITETAKANNLNPFRYLNHVLTVLKDHQDDRNYSFIEKLLPWSDQLLEIWPWKQVKNNQSVNLAAGNGGQKMSQYSWFTVYLTAPYL